MIDRRKVLRQISILGLGTAVASLPWMPTSVGMLASTAHAKSEGKGGGNGNGGGSGKGGGGNGSGKGAGSGDKADGKGNAKGSRAAPGASPKKARADIGVTQPNGFVERVEDGRYIMIDPKGRVVINRRATTRDVTRLRRRGR